ncbi:SMI1/KNR4 family protein [Jeotgalibacillus sp. ET6]|uniref:SMI1/KNR4 family protein n=1 Tax=Jeotgalibacillus sp. ET6 TaxID=3037260 RepID=UPI002418B877|nr:SMI1/KNR4 family protein [Jeotgalibacillus sp. ET6]MDG5471396.1 SMI1/KNR4 family protein [Jeotgalibacillus sp. ET6]
MSNLPEKLDEILGEKMYKREDRKLVQDAFTRLGVNPSSTFIDFYTQYEGPFWEENQPFELLDVIDEENNVETYTNISRQEHDFPNKYLVLSEMTANAVLVLDTDTDKVYKVNFEGGDEKLLKGELRESWSSFFEFLKAYFNC